MPGRPPDFLHIEKQRNRCLKGIAQQSDELITFWIIVSVRGVLGMPKVPMYAYGSSIYQAGPAIFAGLGDDKFPVYRQIPVVMRKNRRETFLQQGSQRCS